MPTPKALTQIVSFIEQRRKLRYAFGAVIAATLGIAAFLQHSTPQDPMAVPDLPSVIQSFCASWGVALFMMWLFFSPRRQRWDHGSQPWAFALLLDAVMLFPIVYTLSILWR